jgi:uncharacterized tellurite resistance protein B-like protein
MYGAPQGRRRGRPASTTAALLHLAQGPPGTLVRRRGGGELPRLANQIPHGLFLRGRWRGDVFVERPGLRLGHVPVGETTHDHVLLLAERPGDDERVARLHLAVRLGALTADLHFAALTGALRFGACLEQTRNVQPDIETKPFEQDIHYARSVLATILRKLGVDVDVDDSGGSEALETIADALEQMEPSEARYIAAFAYLLSRVAHADHEVSDAERASMQTVLGQRAGLTPDRAAMVVQLATSRIIHVRGTDDYLVAREFAAMATRDQKRALLDGLFAVSASDDSIVTLEDNEIRRVASEIGLEHQDVVEIRQQYRDRLAFLKRGDERT